MKKLITILFFIFGHAVSGQYFEGVIDFKTRVIDKETGLLIRVHTSTLHIGNGYYRYRVNTQNEFTYEQTRLKDEDKLYSQRATTPYITYEILKPSETYCQPVEIIEHRKERVLKHDVFAGMKYFSSKRTDTLFFSDDLRVNPADYTTFYFGRMNEQLLQLDGSIALKTIANYAEYDFITVKEAVRIRKKKLKPRHFKFPKGVDIAARYTIVENPRNFINYLTQEQLNCYEDHTVFSKDYISDAVVKKVRLKFIFTTEKELKEVVVFQTDDSGLNERAINVIKKCKLDYELGMVNNKPVDTEIYQDIHFYFDKE